MVTLRRIVATTDPARSTCCVTFSETDTTYGPTGYSCLEGSLHPVLRLRASDLCMRECTRDTPSLFDKCRMSVVWTAHANNFTCDRGILW